MIMRRFARYVRQDRRRLNQLLLELFQKAIADARGRGDDMVRSVELRDGCFHWQVEVGGTPTTVTWTVGEMDAESLAAACAAAERALEKGGECE